MQIALIDLPEDRANLLPLTYLKPIGELRIGILKIREKWEQYFGQSVDQITEDYLQEKFVPPSGGGLLINSTILPNQALVRALRDLEQGAQLMQDGKWIGAHIAKFGDSVDDLPIRSFEASLEQVLFPWDFFRQNGQQIRRDFDLLTSSRTSQPLDDHHTRTYGDNIFLEQGATVKAAILNAENGPIYLGKDSVVNEGAIIRGPFALCEGAQVSMGGKVRGDATIGPFSKVGGEYSNSIIMGYSNKAHDGYLGNAVIGEWCNIGAATDSSNLKNNYKNIQVWSHASGRYEDTGLQFCGLIMADHSRCSINTMFNTGTVVGVSASLFGVDFHKKFVPSFSWGGRQKYSTYIPAKAFETMQLVMERRGQELKQVDKDILEEVFRRSAPFRTWEKRT